MKPELLRGEPWLKLKVDNSREVLLKLLVRQAGDGYEIQALLFDLDHGRVFGEELDSAALGRRLLKSTHETQSYTLASFLQSMSQALANDEYTASLDSLPPNGLELRLQWASDTFVLELQAISNSWRVILEQFVAPLVGIASSCESVALSKGVPLTQVTSALDKHAKSAQDRPSAALVTSYMRPEAASAAQRWSQRRDTTHSGPLAVISETRLVQQIAKVSTAPVSSKSDKPAAAKQILDPSRRGEPIGWEDSQTQINPAAAGRGAGRTLSALQAQVVEVAESSGTEDSDDDRAKQPAAKASTQPAQIAVIEAPSKPSTAPARSPPMPATPPAQPPQKKLRPKFSSQGVGPWAIPPTSAPVPAPMAIDDDDGSHTEDSSDDDRTKSRQLKLPSSGNGRSASANSETQVVSQAPPPAAQQLRYESERPPLPTGRGRQSGPTREPVIAQTSSVVGPAPTPSRSVVTPVKRRHEDEEAPAAPIAISVARPTPPPKPKAPRPAKSRGFR